MEDIKDILKEVDTTISITNINKELDKVISDYISNDKIILFEEFALKKFKTTGRVIETEIKKDKDLTHKLNIYKDALKMSLSKTDKDFKKELLLGYNLNTANTELPDIVFTLGDNKAAFDMVEQMKIAGDLRKREIRLEEAKIMKGKVIIDSVEDEIIDQVLDE